MKDGIYFVLRDGRKPHVPISNLHTTHSCMHLWTVPILPTFKKMFHTHFNSTKVCSMSIFGLFLIWIPKL